MNTSKITILFALTLVLIAFSSCSKQQGCMDPAASNYDVTAEEDCCCYYDLQTTENEVVSGSISTNTTWSSSIIYELAGKVIVGNGVILTIEPGTIIKGRVGSGSQASALVIARGGKIMADGTVDAPIIMTSVLDNIAVGQKIGSNLDENDRGNWGGLIICGNAPISAEEGDGFSQIEGIPADEIYGAYGGSDPNDNSGVVRYVSVRHGGALIGAGNEINGITLGGVGNGTVIDHVEIIANVDDGIEFFGGTVNVTNLLVAYQGDDGVDIDQNYAGTVDNFLVIQNADADEGLEIDGPENTLTDGFFTLTSGTLMTDDMGSNSAADIKSKAQGTISNVSAIGFATWFKLRASYQSDCSTEKTDTYTNYTEGSGNFVLSMCEFANGSENPVIVYTASTDLGDVTCSLPAGAQAAADAVTAMGSHFTGATSPTIGADLSEFDNWSWADLSNKY